MFSGLSLITHESQVEWLPLNELLSIAKEQLQLGFSFLLISLAHCLRPLSLQRFATDLFKFFDESNFWSDITQMTSFLFQIFNEMDAQLSPAFFTYFIELLPPISPPSPHCREVLEISIRLLNENAAKLVSQTQINTLNDLLLFILLVPTLEFQDPEGMIQLTFQLAALIIPVLESVDLIKQGNSTFWSYVPTQEDGSTKFDEQKFSLTLNFLNVFTRQSCKSFDRSMLYFGLSRLLKFLLAFPATNESLSVVLDYLLMLKSTFQGAIQTIICPFLIALQDDAATNLIVLHTFIMCAFVDVTDDVSPELKTYIQGIVKERFSASPVQTDFSFEFVRERITLESPNAQIATQVTIFFDIESIKKGLGGLEKSFTGAVRTFKNARVAQSIVVEQVENLFPASLKPAPTSFSLTTIRPDEESDSSVVELPNDFLEAVSQSQINRIFRDDAIQIIDSLQFEWKGFVPLN